MRSAWRLLVVCLALLAIPLPVCASVAGPAGHAADPAHAPVQAAVTADVLGAGERAARGAAEPHHDSPHSVSCTAVQHPATLDAAGTTVGQCLAAFAGLLLLVTLVRLVAVDLRPVASLPGRTADVCPRPGRHHLLLACVSRV